MTQQKITVFISHAKDDEFIASVLKEFLENIFLNADFFVSGSDLGGGDIWIEELRGKLEAATIIIALITPYSIDNKWVYFEAGAGFTTRRSVPLVADGVTFSSLPVPLSLLQGRVFDAHGLKTLISDISVMAGLREPARYPGLEEALARVDSFLAERKAESPKLPSMPASLPQKKATPPDEADPELHAYLALLRNRARHALLAEIMNRRGAYDVPDEAELRGMSFMDLYGVAMSIGLDPPILVMGLGFIPLPKATDSGWKKRNSRAELISIEKEIEVLEKRNGL